MQMHLDIVTPEKVTYQGEVEEIVALTADGEIGILPHHMNLFTKLLSGELQIKVRNKFESLGTTGGFLEVSNNKVCILVDYAIPIEEIEVKKALEDQKQAEDILSKKETSLNEQDYAKARAQLQKALMQIHVARKRHHDKRTPV